MTTANGKPNMTSLEMECLELSIGLLSCSVGLREMFIEFQRVTLMPSGVISTSFNAFGHDKCLRSMSIRNSENCLRSVNSRNYGNRRVALTGLSGEL